MKKVISISALLVLAISTHSLAVPVNVAEGPGGKVTVDTDFTDRGNTLSISGAGVSFTPDKGFGGGAKLSDGRGLQVTGTHTSGDIDTSVSGSHNGEDQSIGAQIKIKF